MTEPAKKVNRRMFLLVAASAVAIATTGGILELARNPGGKSNGGKRRMFSRTILRPSQVLDLSVWKVNLPTTTEIKAPQLQNFTDPSFEVVTAVQFTAHCGDKAQAGSKYPRCELREMNANGSNAAWSSDSGTHTMELVQRVTHLPVVKPAVVCGQIHSDDEYLILVELSGKRLAVRYINEVAGTLDADYTLGTSFVLKIVAAGGYVDVLYNGVLKVHHPMSKKGCYFKAGCYVQSNTATGDAPTAYGQVEISSLTISHA